ncbi:hypothetical protein KP509_28G002800 [Ceratopteris richardii]|uniref:BHLH domain-containing protein n=1 Tax=Ceratopteris richardii TaxID=49495 RepID=A0A8T2RAI5_CERRI|nr:hypothetical protein KP509_28G002800 [Ceratopteris richardii]
MDGSPTGPAFPNTEFEAHHLQIPQGSWASSSATQADARFGFEDHEDARRLLPPFLPTTDSYGSMQLGGQLIESSIWDNKFSHISSVNTGIIGNSMGVAGAAPVAGHMQLQTGLPQVNLRTQLGITGQPMHIELDYGQTVLEHMHTGQSHISKDIPLRTTMMMPQSWVPLNMNSSVDRSDDTLPGEGMDPTASTCHPRLPANGTTLTDRSTGFPPFGNMGYSESHITVLEGKGLNQADVSLMQKAGQVGFVKSCNSMGLDSRNGQESMKFRSKETLPAVPIEQSIKGMEIRSPHPSALNMVLDREDGAQKQLCPSINESDESMGQEVSSSRVAVVQQGLSESSGRKRKAGSQKLSNGGAAAVKPKELDSDDGRPKCHSGNENTTDRTLRPQEQSNSGNSEDSTPKSTKETSKPAEVPKSDFIHVRARRGQATDSHSLAERVRREKISERMKFLQDLVPGCSKVTGKAVMLDEIINYVQSLQRQVERPAHPRVAPQALVFGHQNANTYSLHPPQQSHVPLQPLDQCPSLQVQPFGSGPTLNHTMNTPTSMEIYGESASQASRVWEDELRSMVQMNFAECQTTLDLHGSTFQGQMKVEH